MQTLPTFPALERVVARYRRDVNHLQPGATADALAALEGHLGRSVPSGLRTFLGLHNGASLFRGSLRLRSTSETSLASEAAQQVVLFADGPGEQRWGWAADERGGHVFGPWDGERLEPWHGSFAGWFAGTLAVVETRVVEPRDQASLRFEADPADLHQLVAAGERALRAGRPEEAETHLRAAIGAEPTWPVAWQLLGDALAISDRVAARRAWLQAFRHTRFPLPWPGAPHLEADVLRSLTSGASQRGLGQEAEEWERALEGFLDDQVADVGSPGELRVVVAACRELARARLARGRRREARNAWADLLARCRVFTFQQTPWDAVLDLAALEIDLGHHDEAEALLRRVRKEAPRGVQGRALLQLARVAVTRQEPWAEEILEQAAETGLDEADAVRLAALRVERALRRHDVDEARRWLEQARGAARTVAIQPLLALVALVEGDVARLARQAPEAHTRYQRALTLLDKTDDPELRHRIHLRLGDLALGAGAASEAESHYLTAVQGFARHELPVREGWALLRLARVAPEPGALLGAARDRFTEADLAAGVAAVDAVAGEPGASLAWHLARATAHARARHHAQRSRPPWERCDAERPERRLGAHRLTIAACDVKVVERITREMDACARAMSTGRARAADHPVLQYVAAVDLLSAHRSYEAAHALLSHLLRRATEGPARRALQGAIARSPNAALVDGLLSVVEHPEEHPASAVAEAAELLGLRREEAAVPVLVRLAGRGANPIARKAAVVALGRIGDRRVVEHLVPPLEEAPLAEPAALALLMLGDRRGVDFHGRALSEGRHDLSGSPGEIVGRYGGSSHLLLLINAASGVDDRALGALQGLGLMGDPRAVPTLLEALGSRDRRVVEVGSGALQILTGHTDNVEDPGVRNRWRQWWEAQGDRFAPGVRYREGRLFDAGLLLERMQDRDAWTRRTAYDELVITSGANLPFDSDGPWRLQQAHLRAWREWYRRTRHQQPAGHWYLDGVRID